MGNLSKIVLGDETLEVEDTKARTDIGDVTALKTNAKDNLVKAVNECFQKASDGKALIASALTGMGVETSADATFAQMAEKISTIETGIQTTDATATASQLIAGATAYGASGKFTGTMANRDSITPAISTVMSAGSLYVRLAQGAYLTNASSGYPEASISQDALASAIGLTADKIVAGKSILGISGTGYGTWS